MNPLLKKSLVLMRVVCIVGVVSGLFGCASRRDKNTAAAPIRTSADESSFAAGAGRPPTASTSYSFAKILVGQGRDRDAIHVLTRIIRENPRFVPAYNEIAGVYVRSDRLEDAIALLQSGLKQSPNDPVLHNNLGMCYLLKTDPARALESFSRATDVMPSNPTFRANRAAALGMLGRDSDAEREY